MVSVASLFSFVTHIRQNRFDLLIAYLCFVYKNDNGKYVYTVPSTGAYDKVDPSVNPERKTVADIHTHPDAPGAYTFSDTIFRVVFLQVASLDRMTQN
jgi:hypothetical protein